MTLDTMYPNETGRGLDTSFPLSVYAPSPVLALPQAEETEGEMTA